VRNITTQVMLMLESKVEGCEALVATLVYIVTLPWLRGSFQDLSWKRRGVERL